MASDLESPASSNGNAAASDTARTTANGDTSQTKDSQFAAPKPEKPKPHVCGTCTRGFARLEHLKRHERSHTKEKPFECPECARCFARRDLLLRHQQKLHFQNATSRPRSGRRESVSGAPANNSARVRKNSVANAAVGGSGNLGQNTVRPRANTLGHLDLASLGLTDNMSAGIGRMNALGLGHGSRMSMGGLPGAGNMEYRGMSTSMGMHGAFQNLPKLETNSIKQEFTGSLRTAPPYGGFGGFQLDQLFPPGNTVNPAQLHFNGSTMSPASPFQHYGHGAKAEMADEDDFSWMRTWDGTQLKMEQSNEYAIDESSPSRISSTASPGGFLDGGDGQNVQMQPHWPPNDFVDQNLMTPGPFQLGSLQQGLPNLDAPIGLVSPQILHEQTNSHETYFSPPTMQNTMNDSMPMHGLNGINTHVPASLSNFGSDSPSMSSSMTGSARQSSVTSVSTDSITDATRQALLLTLSQSSLFGHTQRKYSQPSISSPLSPGGATATRTGPALPSTADLQRYVNAYIHYFHPHLPFLHIPSLSFDSVDYVTNLRSGNTPTPYGHAAISGGGGCLVLAMAAIGALYEYDHQASRDLFELAKKMIQLYLEERRKADMSAAVNGSYVGNGNSLHNTPLWLVQAMLLNVIYGHHCGDKVAADIASTHCAALVSLARAAELAEPADGSATDHGYGHQNHQQPEDARLPDGQSPYIDHQQHGSPRSPMVAAWMTWKGAEERKRTLFAVFILSSLLVTAYNHTPAIMNSELLLDLPCDEELWAAESAQDWFARGGSQAAEQNALPFATALSSLLTAHQRVPNMYNAHGFKQYFNGTYAMDGQLDTEIRPSTFGCLVLINALHNYIWETRSRHHGRQWTAQETESMFSHIEPALNAWQSAWKANDHHRLQRPNPFGLGPLSADSIPLLDLAFVRLFVNLGRSKEAFWQRDFDAMADELARGAEVAQHAEPMPAPALDMTNGTTASSTADGAAAAPGQNCNIRAATDMQISGRGSKRERHLRKAAFYAADSLTISSKFALTYADSTAHELPIQSAMCFFDCSQVLAEWASTVQERVGRYLGILGTEDIDFSQVPAIMLLENEDIDLLHKIESICGMLEEKMVQQANILARELGTLDPSAPIGTLQGPMDRLPGMQECSLGSKILRVTAYMLEKAAVWPVTHVMANALNVQAAHMNQRAEASLAAP